jgi:cytochrome bd-type quinol oxidase subunit 2
MMNLKKSTYNTNFKIFLLPFIDFVCLLISRRCKSKFKFKMKPHEQANIENGMAQKAAGLVKLSAVP